MRRIIGGRSVADLSRNEQEGDTKRPKNSSGLVLGGRSTLAVSNNQFIMLVENTHCLSKLFASPITQDRIVAKLKQQWDRLLNPIWRMSSISFKRKQHIGS